MLHFLKKIINFAIKKIMLNILTECMLFDGLSNNEKEQCLTEFRYQVKSYRKNEIIVYIKDVVIQQLILIEGKVKNEMSDFSGNSIKIADIAAPRILAPGFLFGKQSRYPVNIFANSNCKILAISKDSFLSTLLLHKQLQINFINLISNQTQFLTRKINFLKIKTIKAKLAYFLLKQYRRQNNTTIVLPQSQTQLADLFGVTRPSLSRTFAEFKNDAIIDIKGKNIALLNVAALKNIL